MLLISTLSVVTSLIATLLLAPSPLFLGLWVILLALLISLFITLSSTSWLGIIVFLIYVGGLLVIFAYFVALTPNLLIEGNNTWIALGFVILFTTTAIDALNLPDFNNFSYCPQLPIISLLSESPIITITLALILFFALVAVVKLCSNLSGPLRPFS